MGRAGHLIVIHFMCLETSEADQASLDHAPQSRRLLTSSET